eukprot:COSAG01_NODE_4406_length_5056_cov_124.577365_5_plen_150_part_00
MVRFQDGNGQLTGMIWLSPPMCIRTPLPHAPTNASMAAWASALQECRRPPSITSLVRYLTRGVSSISVGFAKHSKHSCNSCNPRSIQERPDRENYVTGAVLIVRLALDFRGGQLRTGTARGVVQLKGGETLCPWARREQRSRICGHARS